jgi:RHS repeat-associated protein
LKTAGETGWTQTYGYDRYGNRAVTAGLVLDHQSLTPTSLNAFNASTNRLTASLYDAAGNQIQDAAGSRFTYDADNRQISSIVGVVSATYGYDGDGHRVRKGVANNATVYVYNVAGQLIAEYTDDPAPPSGGGGPSYLTTDHLGSTRVVTKSDGAVKARYDYVPFGEELPSGLRPTGIGYGGNDATKQKFTQKERDEESGLDYFGARYYSSPQGRFTGPDPNESVFTRQTSGEDGETEFRSDLSQPQHWNRYSYVLNNPLRLIDPDGKKWTESVHLGNAMLNVFAPPGTVLDLGDFLAHTRGVNFFYKDPSIEWAKIYTAGGSPENGGCVFGCFETYEAQPVALSLSLRFDIDEKTGKLNGVAVDLGRQDVISSGQNPLRTVWSPLPGLGRPPAEVTSVQINSGVLRGLTNQQLKALGNAFRMPQQGPLGPIATAVSQAVADEQKRRQEEERKRQEEEKKKKH